MKIDPDLIKQDVNDSFLCWLIANETSVAALLHMAVENAFRQWLEDHSTEIIAQIAKCSHETSAIEAKLDLVLERLKWAPESDSLLFGQSRNRSVSLHDDNCSCQVDSLNGRRRQYTTTRN